MLINQKNAYLWQTGLFGGLVGMASGYVAGSRGNKRTRDIELEVRSQKGTIVALEKTNKTLRENAAAALERDTQFQTLEAENEKLLRLMEGLATELEVLIKNNPDADAMSRLQAENTNLKQEVTQIDAQRAQYEARIANMADAVAAITIEEARTKEAMQNQAREIDRLTHENEQLQHIWN